eukprot:2245719-Rhodomonas_salina.3
MGVPNITSTIGHDSTGYHLSPYAMRFNGHHTMRFGSTDSAGAYRYGSTGYCIAAYSMGVHPEIKHKKPHFWYKLD